MSASGGPGLKRSGGCQTYRDRVAHASRKVASTASRVGIAVKGAVAAVQVAVLDDIARVLRCRRVRVSIAVHLGDHCPATLRPEEAPSVLLSYLGGHALAANKVALASSHAIRVVTSRTAVEIAALLLAACCGCGLAFAALEETRTLRERLTA